MDFNGFELARFETHPAFDAFSGIDFEWDPFLLFSSLLPGDCFGRADLNALTAFFTDIGGDSILKKASADLCRTPLVDDVFLIFLSEIPQGGQNGIGCGSSELA